MEQALNSHVEAHSGFLETLLHWTRRFQAYRQHRRKIMSLSKLPSHLLRDIDYEHLIARPTNPGFYGH